MYELRLRRLLNLLRLLDLVSAEPLLQIDYLKKSGYSEPENAMLEFFEDLSGYESLISDMAEARDLDSVSSRLFSRLLELGAILDSLPNPCTEHEIFYGDVWQEVRDTAMLFRLSLSSTPVSMLNSSNF